MAKKIINEEKPVESVLKVDRDEFINGLNGLIDRGKNLLNTNLNSISTSNQYGYAMGVGSVRPNKVTYNESELKFFNSECTKWVDYCVEYLKQSFADTNNIYQHQFGRLNVYYLPDDEVKSLKDDIQNKITKLESLVERTPLLPSMVNKTTIASNTTKSDKVFIVHGHAEDVNQEVARTIEKLGLDAIILREQPNSGKTIIEKFEDYAKEVNFAVILLTADDKVEGVDSFRARQNVVFEMGYFIGAMGRNHVMCMLQENVEKPGDMDGVVYTQIDKEGVWKYSLVKELKACGYSVDANKVL